MKPLIAITSGEVHNQLEPWSPVTLGQSHTYIEAIIQAGGVPFIIPITNDLEILRRLYDQADGILFAGGNDPNPALYGEQPYAEVTDFSAARDATDMQLLRWALEDKKPFLGICRGMQLLNILRGGTLYQHLPKDLPHGLDHNSSTKKKTLIDVAHTLRIKEGSELAAVLQRTTIGTNTHHHQGIKKLGEGLEAVAWSEDNLIEALELPGQFSLCVQSHPESLAAKAEPNWQKFFAALVSAAHKQ